MENSVPPFVRAALTRVQSLQLVGNVHTPHKYRLFQMHQRRLDLLLNDSISSIDGDNRCRVDTRKLDRYCSCRL
jgi:hypothetical protein